MVDYSFPGGLRSPMNLNHFQVPCEFVDRISASVGYFSFAFAIALVMLLPLRIQGMISWS